MLNLLRYTHYNISHVIFLGQHLPYFFKRLFCHRLVTLMSNWKKYFVLDFGFGGSLWWCGICDTTKTLNPMSIEFFTIWWSNHLCTIGKEMLSHYGANKPSHKYSCKNDYKVIHLQIAPILDDFNGFSSTLSLLAILVTKSSRNFH